MTIKNSYIFLDKNNTLISKRSSIVRNDTDINGISESAIIAQDKDTLISIIEDTFPNAKKKDNGNEYVKIFCHVYTMKQEVMSSSDESISIDVQFVIHQVVKTAYMDIVLDGNNIEDLIYAMEMLQLSLRMSRIKHHYLIIYSYDAISEYYCNKAYPYLNTIERKLRKLLFNVYTVNFGSHYYTKTISKNDQDKIKSVLQKRHDDEVIEQFFYGLELNDIQRILFEPNWSTYEDDKRVEFLANNRDLSKLSDEELRSFISELRCHSDWERLFSDKMCVTTIMELIESIRVQRNNIAHCKFFSKKNYERLSENATQLIQMLDKAIIDTEYSDYSSKNLEGITKALIRMAQNLGEILRISAHERSSMTEN